MVTARESSVLAFAARHGYLVLRVIAGTVLLIMMGLTVVDVVMRYWFNSSVAGAYEITELLLAILIFAGFPLVSQLDRHVSVDVLEGFFSDSTRRALDVVRQVVATAVLATMIWLLWDRVNLVLEYNDVTSVLYISLLPVVCFMFVLAVATTLVHVSKLILAVRQLGGGGSSVPDDLAGHGVSGPGTY